MQFFQAKALQFLWAIPVVFCLCILVMRYKQFLSHQFALQKSFIRIATENSKTKYILRGGLILLVLLFLILALARPQWGEEIRVVKRHGLDIVFMLDSSLSMLVEDLKPNRMHVAKRSIGNFIEKLKGDRIGMVAFAGTGFLQVPLTVDYSSFRLFLDAVDVGYIPVAGSSLTAGLVSALHAFKEGKDEQKVIVVFSDGESHTGEGEELINEVRKTGIRIYAVGVGTEKGGPIALRSGSQQLGGYKKDERGELVISKLEDEFLKRLTKETGGLYYPSTPSGKEIALIYQDIEKMGKKELSEQQTVQKEDRFQLFLAIALLCLAMETILGERKGLLVT